MKLCSNSLEGVKVGGTGRHTHIHNLKIHGFARNGRKGIFNLTIFLFLTRSQSFIVLLCGGLWLC